MIDTKFQSEQASVIPAGKASCKEALQKELGLRVDKDIPLLGFIGRLDYQKGPDIILDAVAGLAQRNCQVLKIELASR